MCGRFAFFSPRETVTELFGVDIPLEFHPRYNITPSQPVVAIRADDGGKPSLAMLRWGLIPSWARDPKIGQRLINARAETVHEKPSFRAAFKRRRCVILADGFYEWRKNADGKQPYFIAANDRAPFAMAGLWERWTAQDEPMETCTIITRAASPVMQPLHARMPVILSVQHALQWISPNDRDVSALRQEIAVGAEAQLTYWAVSRDVNNPRNDSADLILDASAPGR